MSERVVRVGEALKAAVSEVLLRGIKDPRVTGLVSVTDVWVSGDLREARIFVSIYGDERVRRETLRGLRSSQGYVRREIAQRISARVTPSIEFHLDDAIERGTRVLKAMREAGIDVDGRGAQRDEPVDAGDELDAEPDKTILDAPADDGAAAPTVPTLRVPPATHRKHTEVRVDSADPHATTLPSFPKPRARTKDAGSEPKKRGGR
jgi:ribosome-binding factor A